MTAPTAESNRRNPALDAALTYIQAGLSVVPIKRDGSKAPAVPWKQFQARRPTDAELIRWFDRADPSGVAVLGGAVSGGLECIDFDVQAPSIYPQWRELVEAEAPGLADRLCVIRTPRPGFHVRYRCTETTIPGNTKLAVDPALPKDERCLIETRGEGGYAIVPGGPPECHPSGRPYEHFAGPELADVQTITAAERQTLLRCARSFDRAAASAKDPATPTGADLRPGDEFNRRGPDWSEILTGWTVAREFGGKRYWRRPGKEEGWSATTGVCTSKNGVELFACFSENADPFQGANGGRPCTCYSKFSAYTLLHHAGDYKAAAKELARQGYGERHKSNGRALHQGNGKAGGGLDPEPTPERGDAWEPAEGGPPPDEMPDDSPSVFAAILAYWRDYYRPTFKRGTVVYSDALGREVKPAEAVFGAPAKLLAMIAQCRDAPRDRRGNIDRDALPRAFRNWAACAWAQLLLPLRDEEQAEEVSAPAGEAFRAAVGAVLHRIVTLGHEVRQGSTAETKIEHRSLIDWCVLFAKPGKWQAIRSYQLWTRKSDETPDLPDVAVRANLFRQVQSGELAKLSPKQFAHLARMYDVGAADDDCRPGGARAVRLAPAFVADLLARPELPVAGEKPSPAHTCEKPPGESATEGEKPCMATT